MNKKNNFGSRYQVLELLSTGGMAHIYKAMFTSEGFTRPVVIKKILEHYEHDPRWVDSFLNEAKIMSLLNHSHIVQVYDFGKSNSGYFLAMEYVEGGSLLDLIEKAGAIPESFVLYIGLEILKGLSYAHKKGVLHRDISPSNILLSKAGEVKLTDFGVAKLQSASLEPTQFLKGKESYMSPEQRRKEILTYASDLYSLAVVLQELLAEKVEYLKRGLTELASERFQTCEEFEEALLQEVKRKQSFVTQREFAQFLKTYIPWKPKRTLILRDEGVLSILKDPLAGRAGMVPQESESERERKFLAGEFDSVSLGIDKILSSLSIGVLLFICIFFGSRPPAFSPKGYLTLNAKPWGEVYVENTYVGTTPLIRASLPTGKYMLTVSNPILKQAKKMAIAIEENQILKNNVTFQ